MTDQPKPTPITDDEWASLIVSAPWDAAADQMAQVARRLERELSAVTEAIHKVHPTRRGSLVDMVEDLDSYRETTMNAFRISQKELAAERALADRLAETLRFIEEDCDWKAGGDHWHGSFGDDRIGPACDEALAAWKEARRGS